MTERQRRKLERRMRYGCSPYLGETKDADGQTLYVKRRCRCGDCPWVRRMKEAMA